MKFGIFDNDARQWVVAMEVWKRERWESRDREKILIFKKMGSVVLMTSFENLESICVFLF